MDLKFLNGDALSKKQKGIDQSQNGQSKKSAFGTKEWAKTNVNCVLGCSNDCSYCYAKSMAIRFKRKTSDTWKDEEIITEKVDKTYRKRDGVIMFPSSHDITLNNVEASLLVLKKLLDAGNDVLIVTKPRYDVIVTLCDELKVHKEQILFRFTIGSANSATLRFWEPEAPSFEERLSALEYAYQQGFKTSMSMEPTLDLQPGNVVEKVYDYVTNDIWIGLPNKLNQRLKMNGYGDDAQFMKAMAELQKGQSVEWVLGLVECYKDDPKIRWKESIKQLINKNYKLWQV